MSTVATDTVKDFARDFATIFKSAELSGIVGDPAHAARGGYHMSRADNPKGNYSIVRADDQYGPADAAAAVDMDLSTADMILCTRRLINAYSNTSDPRRKYVNAFNGWLGTGAATRYDFYAVKTQIASPDHKWHIHLEIRRKYLNSASAMRAILSILRGETVADYMKAIGVAVQFATAPNKTATPAAPAYPGRVLKRNDAMKPDANVAKWQARMIARGWTSLGKADGLFGAKTESVVRKFQTLCKVSADGLIGPVTWALPWSRPLGS
jgi:hypothetical protein